MPGSAPPLPTDVLDFLGRALVRLCPDIGAARAALAQARAALSAEEREASMIEEEGLDGALSSKQAKALAASQARLPLLRKAAAEAAGGVADGAGRAANIERPVSRHKRQFGHGGQAGAAQLMQLEEDEWGQRSIATARLCV